MSLGYEFAPIDVSIADHPKAFAAGIEAMGLWLWGMAHAKKHKTFGHVARAAALGALGGKQNAKLAKRLVDSGLWIPREDGSWDIHNFEAKGPGKSSGALRAKRHRDKVKGVTRDAGDASRSVTDPVTRNVTRVTSASVSVSSESGSGSGSDLEIAEVVPSARARLAPEHTPSTAPPEWWAGALSAAVMAVGGTIADAEARWAEYAASRERKGWAANHRDAVGWLCAVVRGERERAKSGARAGPKRDAEITRQPFDENAPWIRDNTFGDTGS